VSVRITAGQYTRPVDLRASPGERVIIEAKGGAVLSRLLRTLAGLRPAEFGTVERVGGPLAYVFTEGGLFAGAPLSESVRIPLLFAGLPLERMDASFRRFGIGHLAGARPSAVGPEARRLAQLARAHALGARLLFVEEPTAQLSSSGLELVTDWLEERRADGVLVVAGRQDGAVPTGETRVRLDATPGESFIEDDP